MSRGVHIFGLLVSNADNVMARAWATHRRLALFERRLAAAYTHSSVLLARRHPSQGLPPLHRTFRMWHRRQLRMGQSSDVLGTQTGLKGLTLSAYSGFDLQKVFHRSADGWRSIRRHLVPWSASRSLRSCWCGVGDLVICRLGARNVIRLRTSELWCATGLTFHKPLFP